MTTFSVENCIATPKSGCKCSTSEQSGCGKPAMFKRFSASVLIALVVTCVSPAGAQSPQGTSIGSLTCKMAPSIGQPHCAYELEESASGIQTLTENLKDAVVACKAEIAGVCGKTVPGQGRIAACLMANRASVSKGCEESIQKVESLAK